VRLLRLPAIDPDFTTFGIITSIVMIVVKPTGTPKAANLWQQGGGGEEHEEEEGRREEDKEQRRRRRQKKMSR
jgi:hypothetical protein